MKRYDIKKFDIFESMESWTQIRIVTIPIYRLKADEDHPYAICDEICSFFRFSFIRPFRIKRIQR